jgi:hypothetical protein
MFRLHVLVVTSLRAGRDGGHREIEMQAGCSRRFGTLDFVPAELVQRGAVATRAVETLQGQSSKGRVHLSQQSRRRAPAPAAWGHMEQGISWLADMEPLTRVGAVCTILRWSGLAPLPSRTSTELFPQPSGRGIPAPFDFCSGSSCAWSRACQNSLRWIWPGVCASQATRLTSSRLPKFPQRARQNLTAPTGRHGIQTAVAQSSQILPQHRRYPSYKSHQDRFPSRNCQASSPANHDQPPHSRENRGNSRLVDNGRLKCSLTF